MPIHFLFLRFVCKIKIQNHQSFFFKNHQPFYINILFKFIFKFSCFFLLKYFNHLIFLIFLIIIITVTVTVILNLLLGSNFLAAFFHRQLNLWKILWFCPKHPYLPLMITLNFIRPCQKMRNKCRQQQQSKQPKTQKQQLLSLFTKNHRIFAKINQSRFSCFFFCFIAVIRRPNSNLSQKVHNSFLFNVFFLFFFFFSFSLLHRCIFCLVQLNSKNCP